MLSPSPKLIPEKNIEELGTKNWTVIDGIWDTDFVGSLKTQAESLYSQGLFRPAKIGASIHSKTESSIRSDEIFWLEPKQELAKALSTVKNQLNENFYLGLKDIECHFARYASGANYEEHRDQSPNSLQGERVISLVLYMNSDWQPEYGGQLQIRDGNQLQLIEPVFGRLVLMRSEIVLHSVLASKHERWSLTGWYRRS